MLTHFLLAALVVTAVAAWTDGKTGAIPNWLTLGALVAALASHFVAGVWFSHAWQGGLRSLGASAAGALLCSAAPLFLYWKGAIGGGDVKLFAALGALCHPLVGIEMEMYGFVAAALIAPAKLAYDGRLLGTLRRSLVLLVNPFLKAERRRPIPEEMMTWFRMGPAILVGACATVIMHWGER
jgi:prepilin peptidase CpaA